MSDISTSGTPTAAMQPSTPKPKGSFGGGLGIAWAVFVIGHVLIFVALSFLHLYVYGLIPILMLLPEQALIMAALVLMYRGQWHTSAGLLLGMGSALALVAAFVWWVARATHL